MPVSIKHKMLLSFGLTALVSIALIAGVVSWRMNRSIVQQTDSFVKHMTESASKTLSHPHETATAWMRKSVRRSINNLRHHSDLVDNLEAQRPLELMAILENAATTEDVDLVVLFNLKGQLQASFPLGMNTFEVEEFLTTYELWQHAQQALRGDLVENVMLWDAITLFDAGTRRMLKIDTGEDEKEPALALLSAAIIENDFGDPLGFCLVGKLLNNNHELLQQVSNITGFASAIYLGRSAIAQAGFGDSENALVERQSLKLPQSVQNRLRNDDSGEKGFQLMLAGRAYLTICSPLTALNGDKLGVLLTGIPEAQITELKQQIFDQDLATKKSLQQWILGAGIVSLVLFAVVSLVTATQTIKPLKNLSDIAKQVALGDIQQQVYIHSRDEIGDLSHSIHTMVESFQKITAASQAIAHGELEHHISPRSERDLLGHALQHMSDYLSEIAAVAAAIAEGDLTASPSVRSENDVFGRSMRVMTEGLHSLILQIRATAEHVAEIGTTINSLTEQDTQLAQQVQGSVERMISTMLEMGASVELVAHNMDSLLGCIQQTSSSVAEMTTSVTTIASNTTELAEQTRQMNDILVPSIEGIRNITAQTDVSQQLSRETEHDALEGQQTVEQIRKGMDSIQQTNRKAVAMVNRFAQQSEEIGTVLDVIQGINEQSSLLALNASIIAAQAGSHGRGFSVIAEEMRSLSNGVGASTKDIAALVEAVQRETNALVQTINNGTAEIDLEAERTQQAEQRLQKILSSARRSATVAQDIAEALHRQAGTGHDIVQAINNVSSMTAEITQATNEQKNSTLQIRQVVDEILTMASQAKHATDEQSHGVSQVIDTAGNIGTLTEQNLKSSQRISQTAIDELAPQAQNLLRSVERFTLRAEKKGRR